MGVDDLDEAGQSPTEASGSGRAMGFPRRVRDGFYGLPAGEQAVELIDECLVRGGASVAGALEVEWTSARIRPGLAPNTMTRSASRTASSMLWVTMQIALVGKLSRPTGSPVRSAGSPRSARRARRTVRPSTAGRARGPARGRSRRVAACRPKVLWGKRIRSRPGRSCRSRPVHVPGVARAGPCGR